MKTDRVRWTKENQLVRLQEARGIVTVLKKNGWESMAHEVALDLEKIRLLIRQGDFAKAEYLLSNIERRF